MPLLYCPAKGQELKLLRPFERQFQAQPVGTHQQIVVLHGYRRQHCTRCGCLAESTPLSR